MNEVLQKFVDNLHPSTELLSTGRAYCQGREVDAVVVRNLYGQEIIWGMFSCDRGKFKGRLANNANTDGVTYIGDGLSDD